MLFTGILKSLHVTLFSIPLTAITGAICCKVVCVRVFTNFTSSLCILLFFVMSAATRGQCGRSASSGVGVLFSFNFHVWLCSIEPHLHYTACLQSASFRIPYENSFKLKLYVTVHTIQFGQPVPLYHHRTCLCICMNVLTNVGGKRSYGVERSIVTKIKTELREEIVYIEQTMLVRKSRPIASWWWNVYGNHRFNCYRNALYSLFAISLCYVFPFVPLATRGTSKKQRGLPLPLSPLSLSLSSNVLSVPPSKG